MVKGLYTTYLGMVNSQYRLDVVSNNLANAKTTGYKKEGATTQSFDSVYGIKVKDATVNGINEKIGTLNLGAKIGETYHDWSQGSPVSTGNNYDFALAGDGFFSISYTNKSGVESTMYTRDGQFQMDAEGYLVTKDGDFVLGENGPIQLPTNVNQIRVDNLGNIYADEQYIDRFALADFEDYNYLKAFGENLYMAIDGYTQKESSAAVYQGYTESSNINVVTEMVDMITIARQFESGQRVMNTIDDMLAKTTTLSEL